MLNFGVGEQMGRGRRPKAPVNTQPSGTSPVMKTHVKFTRRSPLPPYQLPGLKLMLETGLFSDVLVKCVGDVGLNCHSLVLNENSGYLRAALVDLPLASLHSQQVILLLALDHVQAPELHDLIFFMYTGEVFVRRERVQMFLKAAEVLQVSQIQQVSQSVPRHISPPKFWRPWEAPPPPSETGKRSSSKSAPNFGKSVPRPVSKFEVSIIPPSLNMKEEPNEDSTEEETPPVTIYCPSIPWTMPTIKIKQEPVSPPPPPPRSQSPPLNFPQVDEEDEEKKEETFTVKQLSDRILSHFLNQNPDNISAAYPGSLKDHLTPAEPGTSKLAAVTPSYSKNSRSAPPPPAPLATNNEDNLQGLSIKRKRHRVANAIGPILGPPLNVEEREERLKVGADFVRSGVGSPSMVAEHLGLNRCTLNRYLRRVGLIQPAMKRPRKKEPKTDK